jgi:uncharacterized protein (DUF433 family)
MLPLISVDPEVMGGVPCFSGSRLPIRTVLSCVAAGDSLSLLQHSWPFLTQEHLDAARAYSALHPAAVKQEPAWLNRFVARAEDPPDSDPGGCL